MKIEKLVQLVLTIDPKSETLEVSVWINDQSFGKGFFSHWSEFTINEVLEALDVNL